MKITKKDWVAQIQAEPKLALVQNFRGEVNPPEPRVVARVTARGIVFQLPDGRESEMPLLKGNNYYRSHNCFTVCREDGVIAAAYRIGEPCLKPTE